MILLDTHIWIWWVHGEEFITKAQLEIIKSNESNIIGISAISCWEVAKLVELKRLELPCSISKWFDQAINYPGVQIIGLSPEIAIESTNLPGEFHKDPADQIIVASSRVYDCPLVTSDKRIIDYPFVNTIS